jgi:hypothetical protein
MINMNHSLNIAFHTADIPPNFLVNPVNSVTGAAYFMNAASDFFAGASYYRIAAVDSVVAMPSNWTVCSLFLMIEAASQTACTDFGDVCHDFGTP